MSDKLSIADLQAGIRHLHDCGSIFVESVPVVERHAGEVMWTGEVQVFELVNHPRARRAYVWSYAIDGSEKRRVVAVLHVAPVVSPETAVRAAIVALKK